MPKNKQQRERNSSDRLLRMLLAKELFTLDNYRMGQTKGFPLFRLIITLSSYNYVPACLLLGQFYILSGMKQKSKKYLLLVKELFTLNRFE